MKSFPRPSYLEISIFSAFSFVLIREALLGDTHALADERERRNTHAAAKDFIIVVYRFHVVLRSDGM